MKTFFKWLDAVPLTYLVLLAAVLGLAPFFPEPHLLEKTRMLFAGQLSRPVDIFDLLLHGAPVVLLGARLVRDLARRRK